MTGLLFNVMEEWGKLTLSILQVLISMFLTALCKYSTTTTIKTTAQIMHKSDINYNNNKDTRKMQYFAANA